MTKLDFFQKRQLQIAKQTLKMPNAIAAVMGGPSKAEARMIVKRLERLEALKKR